MFWKRLRIDEDTAAVPFQKRGAKIQAKLRFERSATSCRTCPRVRSTRDTVAKGATTLISAPSASIIHHLNIRDLYDRIPGRNPYSRSGKGLIPRKSANM